MKTCPNSSEKNWIRKYIARICNQYKNESVFSLIGKEAKMVRMLDKSIKVISAENNEEIFSYQKDHYDYELNFGEAYKVLPKYNDLKVIWLDFFGNACNTSNFYALQEAKRSLSNDGLLFVTSAKRKSHEYDDESVLKMLFPKVEKVKDYLNGRNAYSLFICSLN